jgi:hypothetical protein
MLKHARYCCEDCAGTVLPVDGSSWLGICDCCLDTRMVNTPERIHIKAPEVTASLALARLNDDGKIHA